MTQSKVGVTLDGVCTWQLLEGEEVVRGGVQHNLLLDSGLDNIGTYGLVDPYKYACVGTGTSEPAVTQTALDAEVARTNVRPSGYFDLPQYKSPGVYTLEIVREFSEASVANKNLTEWGFSPLSQGGVGVRERFRDDNGDPVTLTPDGSQKLRLTYEVTLNLSPATPTPFSVTLAGAGGATDANSDELFGVYSLHNVSANEEADFRLIDAALKGFPRLYIGVSDDEVALGYANVIRGDFSTQMPAAPTYVVGSFERGLGSATISGADYAGRVRNILYAWQANQFFNGYSCVLDDPHIITKDDLHTLTIEGPLISWGRA